VIDYPQLTTDAIQLVRIITGLPAGQVIAGSQGKPAPDGEYAVVNITSDQARGQANKKLTTASPVNVPGLGTITDYIDSTKTQKIVQVDINFYRNRAVALASSMAEANKRHVVSAFLWAKKLGWQRVGPVNNLTAIEQANFEARAQVSLYLYIEDVVEDSINKIYQVEYTVKSETMETLTEGSVNGLPG
jgi:hypothetical protein